MFRAVTIYALMVFSQFMQQKDLFVATIQKQLLVQQQVQLNNVFQSQKDGVLIFSLSEIQKKEKFSPTVEPMHVELFNTAFTDLANVKCDEFNKRTLE